MSDTDWTALIDLLGLETARRLEDALGGRRLYIAARPGTVLIQVLGEAAAERLANTFAGSHISVPLLRAKRRRILALHRAGQSVRTIAGVMTCSERLVYRVLAEARGADSVDSGQLDLFSDLR